MEPSWIDATLPVRPGMVTWPGDPEVVVTPICTLEADGAVVSRWTLGSHSGTHIDAPRHFIEGGRGVDEVEPWRLVGPCRVLDLVGLSPVVRRRDLEPFGPMPGERLLLKTGGGASLRADEFVPSFVALDEDAARLLAEADVALVGIDALSIEPLHAEGHPAHHALLSRGIPIVEGLDLTAVEPGEWDLVLLPLRLEGGDAAPARALLRPTPGRASLPDSGG